MKLIKWAELISVMVTFLICQSCGGKSNTSGTLTITAPKTVAAGKPLAVSALYTNANTNTVQGLSVSFSANSASVSGGSVNTDTSGVAATTLETTNNISADQNIVVTAQAEGLTQTAVVTLKANALTITAPAPSTGSFPAGSLGTLVPNGDFITYTDGDGLPLTGKTVTIYVDNLTPTQNTSGADVLWDGVTSYTSGTPITRITDSSGNIPASTYTVTSDVPAAGVSTTVTVRFKCVVTVVTGVDITIYKDAAFTFTGK